MKVGLAGGKEYCPRYTDPDVNANLKPQVKLNWAFSVNFEAMVILKLFTGDECSSIHAGEARQKGPFYREQPHRPGPSKSYLSTKHSSKFVA